MQAEAGGHDPGLVEEERRLLGTHQLDGRALHQDHPGPREAGLAELRHPERHLAGIIAVDEDVDPIEVRHGL